MILSTANLEIIRKHVPLQCVFHSIRFKVNKKDWLSGIDSLFFCLYVYNRYVSLYNISQIAMMCPILPPKQNR